MILVVDDRPENILPLKKILELNGFAVDTAESGEEALKRILKTAYSVIILDVQMPGMDGFEVANAISGFSKARDTSIIFLSAVNTEKKFITQGYTSGGTDYLTKPVDPDILVLKVKTLDKLYRQQQELRAAQESLKKAAEQLEIQVQHRTQELLAKNAELERANHELQQFTWVVSHDLKEPLRKMQILQDTIREKYLKGNEEAVSYLDRSIRSSARMSHLITDLLTFSQLAIPEPFQPTQLNALLNDLLPDFEDIIERKKGQVTVGPLPVIDAIPVRIRQIFQNLISNSLKFARPDVPPRISIEGERIGERRLDAPADPNGAFCRIRVQDNGIGFHEKYLERIFVMFQRLHDRASYEGTGIGLAIAKKNVEKHGGLITAQSSEGQGAVFVLVLPLRQSHV
ncbi:hybrid sensor histidine kinase/response regulator [Tellurirhabdus rosea]|uniref:hybrid sensor histidine kinase/response regulator n=1 Tax=Tellurirhabdus rosea TaxID=2674997 RepID=UPI00225739D7|nr:response regulator [Tellurirhabdus rosea]